MADATVAWSPLDEYEPQVLILIAGANPVMRPLQYQTWETFSVNWHTDVKTAFTWLREPLLKPLPPGSRVVVVVVVSSASAWPGMNVLLNMLVTNLVRLNRDIQPPIG